MRSPLARAFIWFGAVFLSYQIMSYLLHGHTPFSLQVNQRTHASPRGDRKRAAAIKDAFRYSWDKYETYAFPHDTLRPVGEGYEDDR